MVRISSRRRLSREGPTDRAARAIARADSLAALVREQLKHDPFSWDDLYASLRAWLEQQLAHVSAKAPIAEEIRYGFNQNRARHHER